jgi:hypothetical protein
MPSLDRHLITSTLVLLPRCLAVLRRRGQRKPFEFVRCRWLAPSACTSRGERHPIKSPFARKQIAVTSQAFSLAHTAVRLRQLPGIPWNLRRFARADGALAAFFSLLRGSRHRRNSSGTKRLVAGFDPAQRTTYLLLGRRKCQLTKHGNGAMPAGSRNCHIRQSTFRRAYSLAPANSVLALIVDPARGISRITRRWEVRVLPGARATGMGCRSESIE